jgi:hypothetical protein
MYICSSLLFWCQHLAAGVVWQCNHTYHQTLFAVHIRRLHAKLASLCFMTDHRMALRSHSPDGHTASRRQLLLRVAALAAVCSVGFADMYSYSMPDSFRGQVLAAQGASSSSVMLALVSRCAAVAAASAMSHCFCFLLWPISGS